MFDSVVDNFEDSDVDPAGPYAEGETIEDYYGGDTANWTRTTTQAFEGSKSLFYDGTNAAITSVSGLPRYFDKGETARFEMDIDNNAGLLFGLSAETGQSNLDAYYAYVSPAGGEVRLEVVTNGSLDRIASAGHSHPSGWATMEVDWGSNDEITVTADANGSPTTISATDSTYSASGIG